MKGSSEGAVDQEKAISADSPESGGNRREDVNEDVLPEGGYGWVIVACQIGVNATTWGINTTYGVYSAYYLEHNYFSGGSTFRYAWVGGLSVAVALLSAPIANWMIRTVHFRVPLVFGKSSPEEKRAGLIWVGAVCVVLGQCMAGVCRTYAEFLVCQGVIFGLGLGMLMVPCQPLLAHYFDKRLSLAQGIGAGGSGLGGLVLANTTRLALTSLGVKWSLIINGMISLVVLIPCVILLKGRHKAVGARSAPLQVKWLWHPGFVWVWLWGATSMLAYFIALYSLASYATSALSLTQTQGAALQSILSAGQMLGRPLIGQLLDIGGRLNLTILAYLLTGLSSLIIWLPSRSFGVLILFAIIQGLVGGTVWSAAAPISARVVGVKDLGSALGMFWLMLVIPSLVGEPIAILLLDYSVNHLGRSGAEGYYISIGFAGGMGVLSAMLLYGAKRWLQGSWKVMQIT